MLKNKNQKIFFAFSLVFIAINLALIAYNSYYFALLPVVLLLALATFVSLDKILLAIAFFTPLSVRLEDFIPGISFNLSLPTELLLAGVMVLFFFKLLLDGYFDKKILTHPVSITIYLQLVWILITAITSTMPLVSVKFFISRLWFVVGMYFLATQLFKEYKNQQRFIWLYISALLIVILYANLRLSQYGFDNQKASNWVVWPFYSDHTSYGAMLVMFLFPIIFFLIKKHENILARSLTQIVLIIFILAIIFSYTRAAWLSLFAALGIWLLVILRIKIRTVIISGIVSFLILFSLQNKIVDALHSNESESSGKLSEHVESMANITSDASNLERINRWKCALRMFQEKPFWGWGPGTYKFQYAPFQFSYDRTIISTDFGDLGNAHSEYLGPLSESGVIGFITTLLLVFMVFRTGYKIYHSAQNKEIKQFTLFILLGLATYFIHGVLNNFLDTDKASVPVWAFIAILVSLDVYHNTTNKKPVQN